ncbi:uncharacterized protein BP5553_07561 [Venustampulla echinocandica]|uniref:Transcription factor Iwr1 domain-containing protein n=1 Tax=Venustampulla echinocandica TaxID=2656787 RepID=A0A370TGX3_9HELO|nr:uncharacterized protein BP5553_07561 [Venustampulla echinocandica]RDL34433.1 hypothetical protein BP5553_07561 [Venustampulla echinocandica]
MSLPPVTVHIKRKATDEPVDFLRVHEPHGKRQRRATDFVFSRQPIPETGSLTTPQSPAQTSRPIKQIHRAASSRSLSANRKQQTLQPGSSQPQNAAQLVLPVFQTGQASSALQGNDPVGADGVSRETPRLSLQAAKVRHFHMSRISIPTDPLAPLPGGQIRKRTAQSHPAVFMERKSRTKDSRTQKLSSEVQATQSALEQNINPPEPRRQKKPGLAVKGSAVSKKDEHKPTQPPAPAQATTPVRLPSGIMMPWDVNSEQLAAEMQAYTLQEIGRNISEADTFQSKPTPTTPTVKSKGSPSRFKPKKPLLRYMERHPDTAMEIDDGTNMELDQPLSGDEMDDDSEYIIDTYVRMPAHTLESSNSPKNIGLLVLDSQPDIDDFYLDEWDSDEEVDDEDEDENAEDHYTADYPDDEVDSDDEFGRNPYSYRTQNASDLEEFDEDDATFSDDEADGTKYPWAKQPS